MKKKRALIVEAHSDDSALGAAGFMEKFRDEYEFHFALITVSDFYLHHRKETVMREERLKEYEKYIEHFKGIWHRSDTMPFDNDARMDLVSKALVVREIERAIENSTPDLLICQGPSFHHDHTITYEATIAATRPTARHCPDHILIMENPTYVHSLGPSTDFKPNYYCSLSEEQIDRKIETFVTCFPGQVREKDNYLSPESLKTWAKYRGIECRHDFAEAFQIYRIVV